MKTTTLNLRTNYRTAANWLHNSLILCNEVQNEEMFWENCRFDVEDEEGNYMDIYQTYLTDCSESDVCFLEEHFGLLFSYSERLNLYILCVDHYGTSWDYVSCDTDLECAIRELGE